ncbi:SCY1-like protein 2 [Gigantopelta aegis]|uniref:SCY1-like protein 2 n=1 Tax=Gigantopelta aegis TaxID=1735272 RepID=UPI001B888074|nr:SCY1-like protein 2 [Gigantopelta aegis]
MDMFNRLKSAVTNVLPGIPLARDFDVNSQVASAGPGQLWKVYSAVKKTTKQESSVFVFEKKALERYSRRDRELILESLKRGVQQLTKLRHPKILSVIHPFEESREMLCFATEPVFCSLANAFGNHDNIPQPVPKNLQSYQLNDVELRHGILQVIEGLAFLHSDAKIMHHNICPESIVLSKSGTWKLAGFDFCLLNANQGDPTAAPLYRFQEWSSEIPPLAQPNLNYLAPEYALTMMCCTASDMYSVGVIMYASFNKGKTLFDCKDQLSVFKKNAEELRHLRPSLLGSLPEELQQYVKLLFNVEPSVRPDAEQLAKIPFFGDVGTMTLQYLDSLFQRDNLEKSKFFKGLPKIIAKLPKRVNQQRILPSLFNECVNPDMIPFVLPCILLVGEQANEKEYVKLILPGIIPMFKIQEPIQISLLFLQNINLLLSKTPAQDCKAYILPMVYRALDVENPQIQELCLNIIPTFADLVEYSSLKSAIIPRIKKLCQRTSVLTVRVNCLLCLGKMLEQMDKWYVLDEIIPYLGQIPSREPAVLMSILGILKVTMSHPKLGITKDIMANKVLPFLLPLCIDNNLNLSQFNAYIAVVKEMVAKVETEHRSKLEQLDQMKQEQTKLEITKITMDDPSQLVPVAQPDRPQSMMDKFLSGFGISSSMSCADNKESTRRSSGDFTAPHNDTFVPPGSAKVSLTLSEKQQLAKQQEQQENFKKKQQLTAAPINKKTPTDRTPVKDLTSSLMNSNLQNMTRPTATTNSSPMGSMHGFSPSGTFFSATSSSYQHAPSAFSSPGSGAYTSGGNPSARSMATSKSVDLSTFDTLLPSMKGEKKSLSQMSHANTGMNRGFSPIHGQTGGVGGAGLGMTGYMGQGMMGNVAQQGMMGMMGQQGMMGMSPVTGYQVNAGGFGQPGMFGPQSGQVLHGVPASMQTNVNSAFMAVPQTNGSKQTSGSQKNELDDLLG